MQESPSWTVKSGKPTASQTLYDMYMLGTLVLQLPMAPPVGAISTKVYLGFLCLLLE